MTHRVGGWTVIDGVQALVSNAGRRTPLLGPMRTLWSIDSQEN